MIRSGNPALNDDVFTASIGTASIGANRLQTMTLTGVSSKSGILLLLLLFAASYPWSIYFNDPSNPAAVMPYLLGGAIGSLIVAFALYDAWRRNKRAAVEFSGPLRVGAGETS